MSVRVPSYRIHKSTGQAIVTIAGKDHYLGAHDSPESRERYRQLIAEFLGAGGVARPDAKAAAHLTVAELAEQFRAHARTYYRSPAQLDRIERSLDALLALHARTLARDFGPKALKAVRQSMVETGTLNRRSVNQRVDIIRLAFRWAASEELVPAAVPDALYQVDRLAKGRTRGLAEPGEVRPVPPEHVDAVLPHVFSPVAAMIRTQLLTAMRPGEVVRLSNAEMRRDGVVKLSEVETVRLPGVWVYEPAEWKMSYAEGRRLILVGPRAQAVLAPFLARPAEAPLFSPIEAAAERSVRRRAARKTPPFPSHLRKNAELRSPLPLRPPTASYSVASYRRAIEYGCMRAGVPKWHPHQLRHNAASFINSQFGPDVARVILGHTSVSTTMIYVANDLVKAAEAMRKVG